MHILPIIPARFESERFPGKLLKTYRSKPVIVWPIESCIEAFGNCFVLTDNRDLTTLADYHDAMAILVCGNYLNGTERIADACNRLNVSDETLIVHVQGDEVELNPDDLKRLAKCASEWQRGVSRDDEVYTLFFSTDDEKLLRSPHHVKCRSNPGGWVFSRLPDLPVGDEFNIHVGVYCYRRDMLRRYMERWPTDEEKRERLEQLRWDVPIIAYEVAPCKSINVPEDLE